MRKKRGDARRRRDALGVVSLLLTPLILASAACRTDSVDIDGGRDGADDSDPSTWIQHPIGDPTSDARVDGDGAESDPLALPSPVPAPTPPEVARVVRAFWLAGRPVLGGLPAVRSTEREAETQRALETLASELRGANGAWRDRCTEFLRAAPGTDDELWCAAARAVGRLSLYEWAPALAAALPEADDAGGSDLARLEAARAGLHDLFGRWFRSRDELAPYVSSIGSSAGTALFLDAANEAERVARERLVELLRHDSSPEPAALKWIADPDPETRAGAAAIVGEALARTDIDRAAIVERLFARVEVEFDPRAHRALLEALFVPIQTESPDAPDVVRLRSLLTQGAAGARALAVVRGLALLPWSVEGPHGEEHLLSGVGALGTQLDELSTAPFPDPDALLETLLALETLCDRARSAGLDDELRGSRAREPVFRLMADSWRSDVVRVAAGETLGAFALPHDWPFVIEVLRRGDATPALGHSLLGVLRAILVGFEPGSPGALDVLGEVAKLAAVEDPDLRRRALGLLADESVRPLVATMDLGFLPERLSREEVPDLSRIVIELLSRFGTPRMLNACLADERFEALASDPATIGSLADMCIALAAGDPDATMAAAIRLAGSDAGEIGFTRMRHALRLVIELDEAEAAALAPRDHRMICAWAWQLHVAGVDLALLDEPNSLIERIIGTHWQKSAAGADEPAATRPFDEAARFHVLAIALARIATREVDAGSSDAERAILEAEQTFHRALKAAGTHVGMVDFDLRVQRDRARFRDGIGESVKALSDYRDLVERDALAINDLRRTIELLASVGGATGRRVISPETFRLTLRLVARANWKSEPASVRLEDLRNLCESALRSGDPGYADAFLALFGDLPPMPAPPPSTSSSDETAPESETAAPTPAPVADLRPDRIWSGLTGDAADLGTLHELVARVRASLPATATDASSAPESDAAASTGATSENVADG